MLTIQPAHPETPPSKAYADACWRDNPRISPDYWRDLLGDTVGKLALDWRAAHAAEHTLALGANLVLTTPATHAEAEALIATHVQPAGAAVTLCLTATPDALPQPVPTYLVWQVGTPPTPGQAHAALVALETMVMQGRIAGYGLADGGQAEANPGIPLHQWLELAQAAAAQVYGRRKRPGLRLLVMEMDLLNLTPLTHPTTVHKGQPVGALEFAARLGWAVVALPLTLPESAALSPLALQALTHTAQVEHQLNQQLGGWPMVDGKPLFNVLQHLGQGATPWPTPHHWLAWQRHVWPQVRDHWQHIQAGVPNVLCQAIVTYCHQLDVLQQHGHDLADAAAQGALAQVLATLAPHFPPPWQAARPRAQVLGLLTGIPGVTAVAAPPETVLNTLNDLQIHPDFPDVGAVLAP